MPLTSPFGSSAVENRQRAHVSTALDTNGGVAQ